MYAKRKTEVKQAWTRYFSYAMEKEKNAKKEGAIKTEEIADTRPTSAMR